jgi:hypothetical protein
VILDCCLGEDHGEDKNSKDGNGDDEKSNKNEKEDSKAGVEDDGDDQVPVRRRRKAAEGEMRFSRMLDEHTNFPQYSLTFSPLSALLQHFLRNLLKAS